MPLAVGTAGHVDHGKTWLVRALTGKDTDRLPEERERGISIDLGYAPLELPDGSVLSLIDVPGHERFIANMVAGATGIDLFLLVIDGAEGARAQTHEHLAILRLLGIVRGVVAITKADAVDAETLELAAGEAREIAPGAEVVQVSAKTGRGIPELREALARAAAAAEPRPTREAPTRLYVDRVFTLKGIGTVATGTLWSGSISAGDELSVEPAGLDVRARSVQVHDRHVATAGAGQRVAVSLPGVAREAVRRGDALVAPRAYAVSYRIDVAVEELAPLADGARVHVHHGASRVSARVVRAGEYAQLRLAEPVLAARGDRVVLRDTTTLAGGTVLDPAPPRRVDAKLLALVEAGDARGAVWEPVAAGELAKRGLDPAHLEHAGGWHFAAEWLDSLRAGGPSALPPDAAWRDAVAPLLARPDEQEPPDADVAAIEARLTAAGLHPSEVTDRRTAAHLEREGRLVRLGDRHAVARDDYERARELVIEECERSGGTITLARFRDVAGVSRRDAQLLLERFDADGVTARVGDARILRSRARLSRAGGS